MIKNYIKIALRSIFRQKFYALINVTGLAVGICCCLLILTYVKEELSYDNFHHDVENTYRVALDRKFPDNQFVYARTPMPMGKTLAQDLPLVESSTRIFNNFGTLTFRFDDEYFDERNVLAVDSTFFDFFNVEFLNGDKETALDLPNSLIITEPMAIKYFGKENPIGKQLTIENVGEMLVRGVVNPMPSNSHFHFDFLFSLSTVPSLYRNEFWGSYMAYNYIKLSKGAFPESIESQIEDVIKTYMEPQIQSILGISWDQYKEAGNDHYYFLQPLTDIHLTSNYQWELEANGNQMVVYLFAGVSVFILLIACINFINLTTARASNRSREVGMRKVLGALRKQLITQFLIESIFVCLISSLVALLVAILLIPYFNEVSGKSFETLSLLEWPVIFGLLIFSVLLGLFSGLYPAFFLSAFKPISILKGKLSSGAKGTWLRNSLVIFQFGISVILVIGTLMIYQQIQFLNDRSLGFDKDQLIIIERADLLQNQVETFKNTLLDDPRIIGVTGVNTIPGRQINGGTFMDVTGDASERYLMPSIRGDYDLIHTMGFSIVEGRAFNSEIVTDSVAIIVNESAVKTFGWNDPIGKQLRPINGSVFTVIGVVKDFHFESLHQSIGPLALFAGDLTTQVPNVFLAKVSISDIGQVLENIELTWNDFVQQRPVELSFIDQEFGSLYEAEEQRGRLFSSFSVLAIVIACLGAFGLAAFLASQRSKEIGVRKVLGATTISIVGLLSKEFVKLILMANVIAWPVAFLLVKQWLASFAYAIDISFFVFILVTLFSLIIALSTVSFHSIKAALKNPADTLHHE